VLEEAPEERHRVEGHFPRTVRANAAIGEDHLAIIARDDAVVADRRPKDVWGEIPQTGAAIARGPRR
jgi:hypothetical protein